MNCHNTLQCTLNHHSSEDMTTWFICKVRDEIRPSSMACQRFENRPKIALFWSPMTCYANTKQQQNLKGLKGKGSSTYSPKKHLDAAPSACEIKKKAKNDSDMLETVIL